MRFQSRTLLPAALLVGLAASPAIAGGPPGSPTCCGSSGDLPGSGGGGDPPGGTAVPGPVAGVGLGYLVLAGGFYVVRRWRKQNTGE
ncbi:MAG: hypothetical protein WBE80_15790 [Methylocella sp.]